MEEFKLQSAIETAIWSTLRFENSTMTLLVDIGTNLFINKSAPLRGRVKFKCSEENPNPLADITFEINDDRALPKFYPDSEKNPAWIFGEIPLKSCGIRLEYCPKKEGIPDIWKYQEKYPEFVKPEDDEKWTKPLTYFSSVDQVIRTIFPGYGVLSEEGPANERIQTYNEDYRSICDGLKQQQTTVKSELATYDCSDILIEPSSIPPWFGESDEAQAFRMETQKKLQEKEDQLDFTPTIPVSKMWDEYEIAREKHEQMLNEYGNQFMLHEYHRPKD